MNLREPGPGHPPLSPPKPEAGPTAILAEDEPLLADELADLLGNLWPQLRIVARARDGVEALNAIETHAPDLALLDIHMPLLTGIEVARQVNGRCHVAFITSHDEYALEAFDAGAIDYVLKPPTAARLMSTVQRLKARLPRRRRATCSGSTPPSAHRCGWSSSTRSCTSSPTEVHAGRHARR